MVRTDERALDMPAVARHLRAAVTADVEKRTHFPVVIAHHQDRDAAVVIGEVIARLGDSA